MSLFDLTGQSALVTGSSRGIGLALAQGLLEAGARVVVHGRDPDAAEASAARLRETTGGETGGATTGGATTGGGTTTGGGAQGNAQAGETIFAEQGCSGCHTLKAANASGTICPNLDDTKPSFDKVVERVTNGKGAMPSFKGQLSDAQIQAVATYVSSAAGK